jgi:glycerol-3-phosphate dehydrogenase
MASIGQGDPSASLADNLRRPFDVIVVGGGIYGAMVHLEAARFGLRSLLIERGDFGGATSENSLRIVHGGLRYLKSLNVARSVESTRERQWYLAALPRLVSELPCLLPIYGRGAERASVLRLGLLANDAIGAVLRRLDRRSADVPAGRLVGLRDVLAIAPAVPATGLDAGAVWHDLLLRCPGRLVVELLRWAADFGGIACNYLEAHRLLTSAGRVRGLVAGPFGDAAPLELAAPVVINAAGPWAGELAARWGAAVPELGPLVVAWNVLLDRPALSAHAVALKDPVGAEDALKFATPLGGRLLVGTGYAPLGGRSCASAESVAEAGLERFLASVDRCVPSLELSRRDVLRVFAGVLPAAAPGSSVPRARNRLYTNGPRGLFTLSGTKFTTARSAALGVLAALRRSELLRSFAPAPLAYPPCRAAAADGLFGGEWSVRDIEARRPQLADIIADEAVVHLEDLVLRRTTLGDQPERALAAARTLCSLDARWRRDAELEIARLAGRLDWKRAARAMNKPGADAALAITA